MRHKTKTPDKHSLRTLIIFCSVVLLLILSSLVFRLFQIIQSSQFDGEHRFTLAFNYQNRELDLVSFNPTDKVLTHLKVRGIKDFNEAKMTVGVFTDTEIKLKESFDGDKSISSYMWDSLLKKGARSSLSSYDLIRFAISTSGLTVNNATTEEIKLPLDRVLIDQITQELFIDNVLSEESQTIEIVNGTGVAGLGARLERAIATMGGNVIVVSNSDKIQDKSKIIYLGNKTYTVERLEKLLDVPVEKREGQELSDIIIIIGQDKAGTISY